MLNSFEELSSVLIRSSKYNIYIQYCKYCYAIHVRQSFQLGPDFDKGGERGERLGHKQNEASYPK